MKKLLYFMGLFFIVLPLLAGETCPCGNWSTIYDGKENNMKVGPQKEDKTYDATWTIKSSEGKVIYSEDFVLNEDGTTDDPNVTYCTEDQDDGDPLNDTFTLKYLNDSGEEVCSIVFTRNPGQILINNMP